MVFQTQHPTSLRNFSGDGDAIGNYSNHNRHHKHHNCDNNNNTSVYSLNRWVALCLRFHYFPTAVSEGITGIACCTAAQLAEIVLLIIGAYSYSILIIGTYSYPILGESIHVKVSVCGHK